MQPSEIQALLQKQRAFFNGGNTLPVHRRIEALQTLKTAIGELEGEICAALRQDLGKSSYESYLCEIGQVRSELNHMIGHTRRYSREKRVPTPLSQFAARSFVKPSPYGVVLIMSPWNYPFLLTMDPLIDAIAAGNTAVVKPSAYSPATSAMLAKLLGQCFPEEYVAVVTGGRQENQSLLEQNFDYLFFTGSQAVGKEVMRHAAEHLTPVTLELGGKSPCIVDRSAKCKLAARRIVFGKFLNCGQTCVAPDYILCDQEIKEALLAALKEEIRAQFGPDPLENPDYGTIIQDKHVRRIASLIDPEKVVYGGRVDPERRKIEPTILDHVTWSDAVMQEEIFGPVLPILTYRTLEEAMEMVQSHPHPLALYVFSQRRDHIQRLLSSLSFGGGCVNDTIIHLATSYMGFGGVGASGMGSYHGKAGFDTFSHKKSIVDKKTWVDLNLRYQPYTPRNEKLLHKFLR